MNGKEIANEFTRQVEQYNRDGYTIFRNVIDKHTKNQSTKYEYCLSQS